MESREELYFINFSPGFRFTSSRVVGFECTLDFGTSTSKHDKKSGMVKGKTDTFGKDNATVMQTVKNATFTMLGNCIRSTGSNTKVHPNNSVTINNG